MAGFRLENPIFAAENNPIIMPNYTILCLLPTG